MDIKYINMFHSKALQNRPKLVLFVWFSNRRIGSWHYLSFTCPEHEWLQFDLGPPTTVTGLVTRGQGDRKRFITSYSMSYSNDSSVWFFYKDANHLDPKVKVLFL
jgi:hypothetical protein